MKRMVLLVALVLMTQPLLAQEWRERRYSGPRDNGFALTPFVGYRYGGTLFDDRAGLFGFDVDLASAPNYGVDFEIPLTDGGLKLELLLDHQRTHFVSGGGLFTPSDNLGDIAITNYQAGVLVPFATSRSATPYFSVTAGVATLDPQFSGTSAENRFAGSAAIGVKVPVSRNLALRLEERGHFTSLGDSSHCGSCYGDTGRDLYQAETNVGFSFRF